jgi:hypothetical protein
MALTRLDLMFSVTPVYGSLNTCHANRQQTGQIKFGERSWSRITLIQDPRMKCIRKLSHDVKWYFLPGALYHWKLLQIAARHCANHPHIPRDIMSTSRLQGCAKLL